jgi:plastocyanin
MDFPRFKSSIEHSLHVSNTRFKAYKQQLNYTHSLQSQVYHTNTMLFTTALISLVAALGASAAPVASSTYAASTPASQATYTPVTHIVEVGKNGLKYTPPFITAKIGDEVQMNFFAMNHTLVQSSFKDPCEPLPNGIFAGFQPTSVTKNTTGLVTFKTVKFQVDTESPLWFYCAQGNHCQQGMTFAINPPAGSVDTFNNVAATKAKNIAPYGGPVGVLAGLEERFI